MQARETLRAHKAAEMAKLQEQVDRYERKQIDKKHKKKKKHRP